MPTTTNYGWTTPADTDLVKDGAAAIRTLGTAIDTTTKNLNPETTLGDIAYRSSTANVKTRLGLGTAGQVLAVNSGATAPEWKTISSGGITLISEQTASSSTGIDFTSISSDYKQLLLVWTGINHSAGSTNFSIRFNADTGSNYYTMGLFLEGTSASFNGGGGTSMNGAPFGNSVTQSGLNDRCHGIMLIDNYASTTKLKNFNLEFCYTQNTSTNRFLNYQGVYDSTSAITQINIVRTSGTATMSNATNTSIRLYGLS
jgi:hypothetical protein